MLYFISGVGASPTTQNVALGVALLPYFSLHVMIFASYYLRPGLLVHVVFCVKL